MQREESHTDLGVIKIHDNVIASIASIAAKEIEGIKGVGKSKTGILQLIHKDTVSSIKIKKDKNGEIVVQVPIVIKYGFNIPDTANRVQENVRNSLEKMTNLSIREINIDVQGIERG
jgi:uncharacterized alkaline shock family protein YloU